MAKSPLFLMTTPSDHTRRAALQATVLFYTICYILIICTTTVTLGLCLLSWSKRHTTSGFYLFLWMLSALIWSLGTVVCMNELTPQPLWEMMHRLRMSAISLCPIIMIFFALEYTDRRRLITPLNVIVLSLIPAITQVFNYTSLRPMFVRPVNEMLGANFISVKIDPGLWFHVHASHGILLSVGAGVVLVHHILSTTGFYRRQTTLLFTGYLFPVAAAIIDAYGPESIPALDYTAIVFPFTAVFWYVALFRYKLLELAPIARDRVVDLMQDAVIVLNPERLIIDVNPAARDLFGLDASFQILGTPLQNILGEHSEAIMTMVEEREARAELALQTPLGRRVFDVKHHTIDKPRARDPLGGMLVMRDITDHVLLIEELDSYAHTVAHDLKNPLNAMNGYLEMIEEDTEDIVSEETFDDIRRAQDITRKMGEIVHELLLMASMRTADEVPTEPILMDHVIAHVESRLSVMLRDVEFVLPSTWPVALGQPAWIEEVWANYVSNAIKYGGDPPRVEVGADEPHDGFIRFWVQDNGAGLTEEKRQMVFQQFARLEEHNTIQGHGVGLSIVTRIVTRLGGGVGVESAPGQGSRFWFTLPSQTISR